MAELEQIKLFDIEAETLANEHWQDMPEYIQQDLTPYKSILVNFRNHDDYKAFEKLMEQRLTMKSKSIFYPKLDCESATDKVYINTLNKANE